MKIQLWSSNYDPEPTGIAPVSTAWAQAMRALGHEVDVVSAHPHYPEPRWGSRVLPYREVRDGVPVLRLPILAGRSGLLRRIVEQLSFLGWLALTAPFLGLHRRDAVISVSPSFPALLVALLATRASGTRWILWVQDILPDGAASTGYLKSRGPLFTLARRLEAAAYRDADLIFVISPQFERNLIEKGVPESKLRVVLNPATLPIRTSRDPGSGTGKSPRILWMGNVGRSQGLPEIVRAFESNEALARMDARLVITGTGVALDDVAKAIESERVELAGVVSEERLEEELSRASLGAVTQSHEGAEFNLPSKLMNYLAVGLPVLASVEPDGGVAKLLTRSGGGWVTDRREPALFAERAAELLADPKARGEASLSGLAFAAENLSAEAHARITEGELETCLEGPAVRASGTNS